MHSTLVLTSFFLSLRAIAAQNSVVPLLLPGFDQQPLIGSIVGSASAATTYVVACSAGTSSDACGVPGDFTVTEGPSTLAYTIPSDPGSIMLNCDLTGTTSAVCTAVATGFGSSADTSYVTTPQASELQFIPVTLTDGAAIASASASASAPASASASASASTSATAASASVSASASAASPSPAASTSGATATSGGSVSTTSTGHSSLVTAVASGTRGTSSATNSVASSPSTAGMPRITGKAAYVLGGAVAAAGLVLGGM